MALIGLPIQAETLRERKQPYMELEALLIEYRDYFDSTDDIPLLPLREFVDIWRILFPVNPQFQNSVLVGLVLPHVVDHTLDIEPVGEHGLTITLRIPDCRSVPQKQIKASVGDILASFTSNNEEKLQELTYYIECFKSFDLHKQGKTWKEIAEILWPEKEYTPNLYRTAKRCSDDASRLIDEKKPDK